MTTTVNEPLALVSVVLWAGFVLAISFMEAWIKFRAPGVTVPLGLGIGRLVFKALNRVEWTLAIIAAFDIFQSGSAASGLFAATVFILALQTAILLPALDKRAVKRIKDEEVAPSSLHIVFILSEVIKVALLGITAASLLNI